MARSDLSVCGKPSATLCNQWNVRVVPGAFPCPIGEQVRRIGVERQRLRGLDVVGRQADVAKLAGIHARQLVQGLAGAVDADRPEQGLAQGLANGLQERRKVRGPAVPNPFKSV